MPNCEWFKKTESYFRKMYDYDIKPGANSPFGLFFLQGKEYVRSSDFRRLAKRLHKYLKPIHRELEKMNKQFSFFGTLPDHLSAFDAFEICLSHFGRTHGRWCNKIPSSLANLYYQINSVMPSFEEYANRKDKTGGRPGEYGQGYFIFQLSHLFVQRKGTKKGKIDWHDCRELIEYYYNHPSKQYRYLKPLLNLELKKIYSNFKKDNPKTKCDEEIINYLRSPKQYRCGYILVDTIRGLSRGH